MAPRDLGTTEMPQTDGLSEKYKTAVADSGDPLEQETAALFGLAERGIEEDEDFDAALASASAALQGFRSLNDRVGEADALRLVIHAHRLKANQLHLAQDHENARRTEDAAEKLADQMAASFKALGDKRGEAAMLLSAAEVAHSKSGSKHWKKILVEEAIQQALEVRSMAREVGDKELEAHATLLLSQGHEAQGTVQSMMQLAGDAQVIFAKTGNKMMQAKALHIIGKGRIRKSLLNGALEAAEAAKTKYKSMDCPKLVAAELYTIASWQLENHMAEEAMKTAQECFSVVRQVKYREGCHAIIGSLLIDVFIATEEAHEALALAEMLLGKSTALGYQKDRQVGLEMLGRAQLAAGNIAKALESAEESLKMCRASGNKSDEASATILMSQILIARGDGQQAAAMANAAARIFRMLGLEDREAAAMLEEARAHIASGDAADAVQVAQDAIEIAQMTGNNELKVAAGLVSGRARVMMGGDDLDQVLTEAHEAQEFYERQVGAKQSEAEALQLLVAVYRACHDYDMALKPANKARKLLQEAGDRKGELNLLRLIATMHLQRNKPAEAVYLAKQALSMSEEVNEDWSQRMETLLLMSQANISQMKSEESSGTPTAFVIQRRLGQVIRPAQDAVELAEKFGKPADVAHAKLVLGNGGQYCYSGSGKAEQLKQMLEVVEDASRLYRQLGDTWGEARATVLQAEAQASLGRQSQAYESAQQAVSLAQACGDWESENRASLCLRSISPEHMHQNHGGTPEDMDAEAAKLGAAVPPVQRHEGQAFTFEDVKVMVISAALSAMDGGSNICIDTVFADSGMDSIAAIEFRNQLLKQLDMKLSGTMLFDYPTVRALCEHIAEQSMME